MAGFKGGFGGFGGGQYGDFSDLGDIFSQMFGGGFQDPNRPRKGQDLQYRMNLTFEEADFGKETTISYTRSTENGGQESKELKVTVPAGVENGQQMRLSGQGEAGFNGGPHGDLFVIINVNPSDKFTRDGSTIYYTLNISFVQAALGDTVEVPTVHGNVEMTIPAGTQTGKTFRLKGKGAPRLRGGSQGDQHVTVKIVTPTKLNDAQKEALLAFAKASGDEKIAPQKKGFFNKVKDALEDL